MLVGLLRFSGHKHLKGDKIVAICDRNCNVLAPFVAAPGNMNESPLLVPALAALTDLARAIGIELRGSIVSFDGVDDGKVNRKAIFNRGLIPNIPENRRGRKKPKRGRRRLSTPPSSRNASNPSNACSPGRTSSVGYCCASSASARCTTR